MHPHLRERRERMSTSPDLTIASLITREKGQIESVVLPDEVRKRMVYFL